MARAQRCLDLLKKNDAAGLELISVSHDGDRVARETARKTWRRSSKTAEDAQLVAWGKQAGLRA